MTPLGSCSCLPLVRHSCPACTVPPTQALHRGTQGGHHRCVPQGGAGPAGARVPGAQVRQRGQPDLRQGGRRRATATATDLHVACQWCAYIHYSKCIRWPASGMCTYIHYTSSQGRDTGAGRPAASCRPAARCDSGISLHPRKNVLLSCSMDASPWVLPSSVARCSACKHSHHVQDCNTPGHRWVAPAPSEHRPEAGGRACPRSLVHARTCQRSCVLERLWLHRRALCPPPSTAFTVNQSTRKKHSQEQLVLGGGSSRCDPFPLTPQPAALWARTDVVVCDRNSVMLGQSLHTHDHPSSNPDQGAAPPVQLPT